MTEISAPTDCTRRTYLKSIGAVGLAGTTGLAGCIGNGSGNDGESKGDIAIAMKSLSSFFFRASAQSTKYEANKLGYDTTIAGAGSDSAKLNRKISALGTRGVSAIVTDPVNSKAQQTPITSAMDNGTPVGVVDTPAWKEATVTVAFDNYLAGKILAKRCEKALKEKYGSVDGRKVVYFHGFLGSYAWNERMKGTRDYMKQLASNSGLTFHNVKGGGSPQEFSKSATEWLSQNPDIDAVLNASSGGFMAGIIQSLDKQGLLYYRGEDDHVLVGAVDGYLSDIEWMKNGYIDFISTQNAVAYGQIVVDLLDKYAIGESTRGVMPMGEKPDVDTSRFYFGEVLDKQPKIEEKEFGPMYTIPTFIMDPSNVDHEMQWPKLAHKRLGLESQAAGLKVSPKGTPPSN